MPLIQKTVYIREEDLEAWNNVPNKAQWISDNLSKGTKPKLEYRKSFIGAPTLTAESQDELHAYFTNKLVENTATDDKVYKFCKHDAVLGMCKKGCK